MATGYKSSKRIFTLTSKLDELLMRNTSRLPNINIGGLCCCLLTDTAKPKVLIQLALTSRFLR